MARALASLAVIAALVLTAVAATLTGVAAAILWEARGAYGVATPIIASALLAGLCLLSLFALRRAWGHLDRVRGVVDPALLDRRKSRRRGRAWRWGLGAVLAALLPFYSETATHAAYSIPVLSEAQTITGQLVAPRTGRRASRQAIVVTTADGTRLSFGCDPNSKWVLGEDCLSYAELERLAGTPIRIDYFVHANAKILRNVILRMQSTSENTVLIDYEEQRARLIANRAWNQADTWQSHVPVGLLIVVVVFGLWELIALSRSSITRPTPTTSA
ncbi:hypothetical protein [Glacieibacterium frigidum]|uniref:Transmembrane protein n=1 Tax=Glacieibacterium frigidum TaxID=2593303 RepID=A0A552UI96_9SPHN|nr:hypothetical protein [Glacieibacterium frigidum]TRW17917.1 hypothetical protein FMM06_07255 [Glacieibacterium frigidum]